MAATALATAAKCRWQSSFGGAEAFASAALVEEALGVGGSYSIGGGSGGSSIVVQKHQ